MLYGTSVIYSFDALIETKERKFPYSRHRSQRIKKKLIKRYGGEFVMKPCMYQTSMNLIAHPVFKKLIEEKTSLQRF